MSRRPSRGGSPLTERGTAQGIFFAGAHLGGGLTPLLVTACLMFMPWRMVFVVFGLIGFVWAAAWFRWFRDEPAEHPAVSEEELKLIQAGRRSSGRTGSTRRRSAGSSPSRNMIALCLMYFTQAYGFYFNITWLPTYLEKARGFSSTQLGLLAGLPLILSALADLIGGLTTDRAVRAYGLRVGRCGIGMVSLLVAGVGLDRRGRGGRPAPLGRPDRRWRARPTASCWARPGASASTSPGLTRGWSPAP